MHYCNKKGHVWRKKNGVSLKLNLIINLVRDEIDEAMSITKIKTFGD